MTFSKLTS